MDMHSAGDAPEWESIPPGQRNVWQQLAADTQGVGTPGNVLSVIGFALVVMGLWIVGNRSIWEGALLVGIGRAADLADGIIAQRTGTKSPLGRIVDAGLDKAGALLALSVFTFVGVLPLGVALAIAAQNIANVIIGTYAPWRYTIINPSYAGKIATAGLWLAILAFVISQMLAGVEPQFWHFAAEITAYSLSAVSLTLGIYASLGYLKIVRRAPRHRRYKDVHGDI